VGGARVQLLAEKVTIPPNTVQPERNFLSPEFVAAWKAEMLVDSFFAPIFNGAAASVGGQWIAKGS
jgi:hypothetical protein